MRILHVIGSFNNGGIENLLINLTRQQVKQGLEVGLMIVTNFFTEAMIQALDSQIKVLYVQKPVGNRNPYYLIKMNWIYHKFNPDILHLHSPYSIPYFKSLGRKEKRFVHIHNNVDVYGYDNSINRYFAISKCVYDVYQEHIQNDNCSICYNGIDFSTLSEKIHYLDRPRRIIQVGRMLMDVKGQDITLNAFDILMNEGYDLQLEYWGGGPDVEKLKAMVRERKLENVVKVIGDVDNNYVYSHLGDFDIAVYSSRHEGLGIAAIEAMGAGVPVVLSDVDGHLEISDNGKFGNLFESGNTISLANVISNLLADYPNAITKALKAKVFVRKNFSIENMAGQLLNFYRKY